MNKRMLKGKSVLIAGGSSGIGLATAKSAHSLGARVILTSRDLQKAVRTAAQVGTGVVPMQLDINNEASVNSLFRSLDPVDHIYIAAGSTTIAPLLDNQLEELLKGFNERVVGSLRVVQAAIPRINEGGSITFTGGISTDRPIAGAWVSGLGTASAEQLARVLVMEFPHIRFNAVSPGYTDTPMWDQILGEKREEVLANVAKTLPIKKVADPEEVAAAVIFLMCNRSITGEVIHIDGGGRLV
jgi:NAD(P)-dependent dehydrogenase (short-subunit alcohol dehydrogenase family)